MKAFTVCEGIAAPLMRDNIDTDMIVRVERIAQLGRGQFAPWAFEMARYQADGAEDRSFILNQPPFRDAQILLSGANFGCGSSREMAVWALEEFGIRCVIAQSFGDIFYANCLQNGLLPIRLDGAQIESLAKPALIGERLRVDLRTRTIQAPGIDQIAFDFPDDRREALLEGIDEIDQTMKLNARILAFQRNDAVTRPWVYVQR
ncbi:3-isopropylmalate dehydratase small subunit [Caballeronia sordidicola]|jgi:3-isopropylmalate/(R)-2-methylmalate dehydratase small subunit|uniref:3-isopropylmalate dehydratase n=1 Tax=Caballeronia sordidicola TaxID=196367 RepID=A0A226WQP9_CABSO|nr:3-isopropylmalate dehydratase small subunit [Caballeronia sordidicola]OXC73160.1 3-isopropylmalate dehydratase small subunit [Caballeronia sordidicola]